MLAGKAMPLCQPLRRRPPEHVHLPGQGREPGTPASQFPLSFWDPSGTQPVLLWGLHGPTWVLGKPQHAGLPEPMSSVRPAEAGQPSPPTPRLRPLPPSPPGLLTLCVFAAGSSATTISLTLKTTSTRSPVTVEPSTAGSG